jgi:hypothetical protein
MGSFRVTGRMPSADDVVPPSRARVLGAKVNAAPQLAALLSLVRPLDGM